MLLYYVTDRTQLPGSDDERKARVIAKIREAAAAGVDYIQLREKDLTGRALERLAREAVEAVRGSRSRLLINSRIDVAIAAGADGVHLRADDITAGDARAAWAKTGAKPPIIAVSCHTAKHVALAESQGADLAVFAPVFEKSGHPGHGVDTLRDACRRALPPSPNTESLRPPNIPVLALGGITLENAHTCIAAGATGIAGIRLFQVHDVAAVVAQLRRD